MSLSFISKATGLKRTCVVRALERLVAKRLLVRSESIIKFNKNHNEWVVAKRLPSSQSVTPPVAKRLPEVVANRRPNKERIKKTSTKETLTNVKEGYRLPDEPMHSFDDRDHSIPRKRTWGDERVDWTLDYTEHLLGRKLTGQERWNRIYARHLANKYGLKEVRRLLDWIAQPDNWWFDKVGQFSTIYKNAERMFQQMDKTVTKQGEKKTFGNSIIKL